MRDVVGVEEIVFYFEKLFEDKFKCNNREYLNDNKNRLKRKVVKIIYLNIMEM